MSGGSKTQTQTTSNQPYKAAQPLYDRAMGDALSQYGSGGLVRPNAMSTVVPYAQQTTRGLNDIERVSAANMGGSGLSGQMQSVINSGGFNRPQQTAMRGWEDTATSTFDPNNNPAFQSVLKQATDQASEAVNRNAASMGRYASGTHQGVMGRTVGDLTARMVGDEYRNWQARGDAARGNLFSAGQQGFANIPAAFDAMLAPADASMGVGSAYEDLSGRVLNDQLRIANERQNAPLANIQALTAVAGGAGGYGNTTQSAQMPRSGFSNALGGLLGGASLLKGIF